MATTSRAPVDERMSEAKHPVTRLGGPYGHPFHPILVTVPIGAWVGSFAFDVASRTADQKEVFVKGSYWLMALGLVGALAAALFGVVDLLGIPRRTKAFRTGLLHLGVNDVVLVLYAVNLAVRHSRLDRAGAEPVGLIALSGISLALLGVSGWLGGKLAYHYGVRVAAEADQVEGYR